MYLHIFEQTDQQILLFIKSLFEHLTIFLHVIGHFILLFSRHPQNQSRRFFTDLYRRMFVPISIKVASLLSRSVVQLYHYWFLHFRCDVIIWNTQMVKTWFVIFYKVHCCIKHFILCKYFSETITFKNKKYKFNHKNWRKIIF